MISFSQGLRGEKDSPRLVDWLLTPIFLSGFLLGLCFFEVLYRLRCLMKVDFDDEWLFRGINRVVYFNLRYFALLKLVANKPNPPESDLPIIVVANHQSMFDITFLCLALPELKLRFVAKKQLARGIPAISIALRTGGHTIIDREDPEQSMPALHSGALQAKEQGIAMTLFPEGTRSRDGRLKKFKLGGVGKIIEAMGEVLILPVAIDGSWRITRFSMKPISLGETVRVTVTPAVQISSSDELEAKMQLVKEQISETLKAKLPS